MSKEEEEEEEEELGVELIAMIVGQEQDYDEIQKYLVSKNSECPHLDWEAIGDRISSIIRRKGDVGDEYVGGERFFTMMNLLDFAMQAYGLAGEDALSKKFDRQFVLACNYSDQGGLERKFQLFEEIVEEAFPLIVERSFSDQMNYYFTRSLNRLAGLTTYWRGEEHAEILYERLANHGRDSGDAERQAIYEVICEFAPWFIEKRRELFPL